MRIWLSFKTHHGEYLFFSPARPPNCGLPCDLSSLAGLVHLTCYPFPKASGQIPLQWRSLARELELPHGAGKFDKPMSRKYETNGSYPEVVKWWIDISKKKVILWFRFYNFTNYILLFQAFHRDDLRHVFPQLFHHQSKPANISQLHLQIFSLQGASWELPNFGLHGGTLPPATASPGYTSAGFALCPLEGSHPLHVNLPSGCD